MAKLIKGTVRAIDIEQKTSKAGNTFKTIDITVGGIKAGTYLSNVVQPREGDLVELSYEPIETRSGFKLNKLLALKNLTLEANMENSDVSNQDN